jgi:hypothetical protein
MQLNRNGCEDQASDAGIERERGRKDGLIRHKRRSCRNGANGRRLPEAMLVMRCAFVMAMTVRVMPVIRFVRDDVVLGHIWERTARRKPEAKGKHEKKKRNGGTRKTHDQHYRRVGSWGQCAMGQR